MEQHQGSLRGSAVTTATRLTAATLALAAPGIAFCQVPPSPAAAGENVTTDEDGSEIVVTAQRREERLHDVPIAITAFTGATLDALGVQGTKQLSQVTPGLNFTQSVYSPQPTIRGIGTRGVGAGEESVVPIYIDGLYQPFIPAADLQFNNIDRIEVLKGPQGALLGRNATGGAINIITRRPSATPTADASISIGSFNEIIAKAYVSGGSELLAGDIAAVVTRNDGYIRDVLRGDRYGGQDDVSIRAKLLFRPTDWLDITLTGSMTDNDESTGVGYQIINRNTIALRYNANVPIPDGRNQVALSFAPFNRTKQLAGGLRVEARFDRATVTALTGVQRNRFKSRTDGDGTPIYIGDSLSDLRSDNVYQEIYATSAGSGPFRWIAGGVYYHDVASRPQLSYQVSLAGVTSLNSVASVVKTDSYAGYVQGDYDLTRTLTVVLAGRYTTEHKRILGDLRSPTIVTFDKAATFRKFTPTFTLQYRPNRDINLYAKAGEAFKSGLFNSQAASAALAGPIAPETVRQYELGAKLTPTSWSTLELSGYVTDYKNLQSNTRDPVTLVSLLQNAGAVSIKGAEAQASVRPARGITVFAGVAVLDGHYKNFPAAQVTVPNIIGGRAVGNNTIFIDAAGETLIRAPSFTANLGASASIPVAFGKLRFSANAYHAGVSYWDILNRLKQSPYTLVNAELAVTTVGEHLTMALWGENLLDDNYDQTVVTSASADSHVSAAPRTVGVRFGFHF